MWGAFFYNISRNFKKTSILPSSFSFSSSFHFFFFHFFFIFSTQTCPRVDQNQGKIRACCYNRDVKILHKGVSFFLCMAFSLLDYYPTWVNCILSCLLFSPFFPLPYSDSEFPCGWWSNVDLKLCLWMVSPSRRPTNTRKRVEAHALSLNFCMYLSFLGRKGSLGRVPRYCFFLYHLLLGFIS